MAPYLQASDWSSTNKTLKTAVRILTSHAFSAPFRSSTPPGPLRHIADAQEKSLPFKDSKHRADFAGASGFAHIRMGEIISASIEQVLTALRVHDGLDHEAISSIVSSILKDMQVDVAQVITLGTKVDAGVFNQQVAVQRKIISSSSGGYKIKDTLSSCLPSSLHLFRDSGSRIKDALDATRSSAQTSAYAGKRSYYPKSQSKKPKASAPAGPKTSVAAPSPKPAGKGKGRSRKGGKGGQQKPPAQS